MSRFYTIDYEKDFQLLCHTKEFPAFESVSSPKDPAAGETLIQMGFKLAGFLMEQVDAYRWKNNRRALEYATAILNLGCGLRQKRIEAQGLMAIGDTLAIEGCHFQTAWSFQQQGATLFKEEQDELGWARSVIGRTGICIEVNQGDRTINEARQALHYFREQNYWEYYLRLCKNITKVYYQLGKYQDIIHLFEKAMAKTGNSPELWNRHMGILANNTGLAYLRKSLYHDARNHFELALGNLIQLGKHIAVLYVRGNIADVERNLGNYREALKLYHEIIAAGCHTDSVYDYRVKLNLIECYLMLNLNTKARNLAQRLIDEYSDKNLHNLYDLANTLLHLGKAEAKTHHWLNAEKELNRAARIFKTLKASARIKQIQFFRARIQLQMHDYKKALRLIRKVKLFFKIKGNFLQLQESYLIEAECLYKMGNAKGALRYCEKVLANCKCTGLPQLHYKANLLAGRIHESGKSCKEAENHYHIAFRCIEEWQKNLTITIKSLFLEDKCEAFHRLMLLMVRKDDPGEIISLLERFRWCSLLEYMTNRKQLYWSAGDEVTNDLLKQLKKLREKHFLFFRISYEHHLLTDDLKQMDIKTARNELASCEEKIRQLVEQLYLRAKYSPSLPSGEVPPLALMRKAIPCGVVLLAYYYHNNKIWVILIKQSEIRLIPLEVSISTINELLESFYFNIRCQLDIDDETSDRLMHISEQLSLGLYSALIGPCVPFFDKAELLYFVPYGILSYVPFNTLYDGNTYLIEQYEIALLPAISLLFRKLQPYQQKGNIIACSKGGAYPGTLLEAAKIAELFDCQLHQEEDATRDKLMIEKGGCFLHIAAHGMHRPDQPDFSFIELSDGQLFADDLIQMDLNYELVTLSGCETGQLSVKQNGGMIGLARGALLAGAGSLVASFWLVDDQVTETLMKEFYELLKEGKSKAHALAVAQRRLISGPSRLLPAQWGAFQLIGDIKPLGQGTT